MSYSEVKKWRKLTKQRLFDAFSGRCGACGLVDDPVAYDFHHLDPTIKDFTIMTKIASWDRLKLEAKKCCMLCAICHRKVHAGILTLPLEMSTFKDIEPAQVEHLDTCPVCDGPKPIHRLTCSKSCGSQRREVTDWSSLDLSKLLKELGSFSALGRHLGVSGVAVKKQMVKRGLYR